MIGPELRRRWVTVVVACVALLFVPMLGWLLFPEPHVVRRPSALPSAAITAPSSTPATTNVIAPRRPSPIVADAPPPTQEITGTVLDPDGTPIEHAVVGCDEKDRGIANATSDADGRFKLPAIASGCEATATHQGFGPSDSVRLEAGRDNTLRLKRGGRIQGVVVDGQGAPVKTYVIAVESFTAKGEPPAETMIGKSQKVDDPSGVFQLDSLVAGTYVLTASGPDGRPPVQSDHIELEAGGVASGVRIVLPRGATVVGTVIDGETHEPVAEANVGLDYATISGANAVANVVTDHAGAFTLVGAPAGPFSLRVTHHDYKIKVVSGLSARGGSTLRQDVELRKGNSGAGEIETDGIGAFLLGKPQGIQIAAILKGSPAERAGVKQFDFVTRIDGVSTDGMSTVEATQRIRGAPGTRVSLAITRESERPQEIVVTRETIVR